MITAILLMSLAAVTGDAADTVVICPQEFRGALQPWVAYRSGQGHRIAFVSSSGSALKIREAIRAEARSGALRSVLLVGDAPGPDRKGNSKTTPTYHAKAKINVLWGSEPEIATDNWYADLDNDLAPDLAIGRLTADSKEELAAMVAKIINYERRIDSGPWRQRINFVAGVGGFSPLIDSVLEMTAKKILTDGIPPEYNVSMTYGSWRSPYCPDPRHFHSTALERINEGCLFWIFMGHGHPQGLAPVPTPRGTFPVFSSRDMNSLQCRNGAPIALFWACYTGAFDQRQDCLAEQMLRAPQGPAAVVCASRVSMPYAMSVFGDLLMDECFHNRRETFGDIIMHAKRRLAAESLDQNGALANNRVLFNALAAAISPDTKQLVEERREHLLLFNLLGDPLMRMKYPRSVTLNTAQTIDAGERLKIVGSTSTAGRCTIELVCRRDRTIDRMKMRGRFEATNAALVQFNEDYRRANNRRWAVQTLQITGGEFQTELQIPAGASGPCFVRVFVEGDNENALGAKSIFVRPVAK